MDLNKLTNKIYELVFKIDKIFCNGIDKISVKRKIDELYEYSIKNSSELKEQTNLFKNKILDDIKAYIYQLNDIEVFKLALFTLRGQYNYLIYKNEDINYYSNLFKCCNFIFSQAILCGNIDCKIKNSDFKDEEIIYNIYLLTYIYYLFIIKIDLLRIENNAKYSIANFDEMKINSYVRYIEDIKKVSLSGGDIYTYRINDKSICKLLLELKITKELIEREIKNQFKSSYIFRDDLADYKIKINKLKEKTLLDELVSIVKKEKIDSEINNMIFNNMLNNFSTNSIDNAESNRNDLVFVYEKDELLFISNDLFENSMFKIEKFLEFGHFEDEVECFLKNRVKKDISRRFNRVLTYKIADILMKNNYILPMERKKLKGGKCISIPRIEMAKFPNKERITGDIDILFYSKHTKVIYNLEFKNYQMMITKNNALQNDIDKVKKECVIRKTKNREEEIKSNIESVKTLFPDIGTDNVKVKSIILTSKPNYYFYKNVDLEKCIYYHWNEFEKVVESQQL